MAIGEETLSQYQTLRRVLNCIRWGSGERAGDRALFLALWRTRAFRGLSHSMKNTKKTLKRRTAWAQIDGSMTMSCKLLSLSPLHRRLRFFPFFVCPLFKRNPIPSSRHRPKSDCFSFHSLSFSVKYKKSCEPRELSGMDQSSIQQLLCCVSVSLIWEPPCRPTDSTCIYIPLKFWTDLLQRIEVVASITARTRAYRYTMAASGL